MSYGGWKKSRKKEELFVEYLCGHGCYEVFPGHRDRKAWVEGKGRGYCPECRRQIADDESRRRGIPLLEGSDRQVPWAFEHRENALQEADWVYNNIEESYLPVEGRDPSPVTYLGKLEHLKAAYKEAVCERSTDAGEIINGTEYLYDWIFLMKRINAIAARMEEEQKGEAV